jgi:ammonia channel protein AmtB
MPLVGLGILILWLGWFGFNPGSTLGALGNRFAEVALVTNLKPAKLCGVDSYGMILASGEEDVKVLFLDPAAKNGDRIH